MCFILNYTKIYNFILIHTKYIGPDAAGAAPALGVATTTPRSSSMDSAAAMLPARLANNCIKLYHFQTPTSARVDCIMNT